MLGQNIRRLRENQGLTRAGLAKKSSVLYRSIENIENGKTKNPGIVTIQKIAKVLGVTVDALVNQDAPRSTSLLSPKLQATLKKREVRALLELLQRISDKDIRQLLSCLSQLSRKVKASGA